MALAYTHRMKILLILPLALLLFACSSTSAENGVIAEEGNLQAVVLLDGLDHPWGMDVLPDGRFLISERSGKMKLFDPNTTSKVLDVAGVPDVYADGQGGLLDVLLHPDFTTNRWVYFSFSLDNDDGETGTELARARLQGNELVDRQHLFTLSPKSWSSRHFGSRLQIDANGYLYVTLGDRGERDWSQDLSNHAGTVLRLHDDGSIPQDNPFIGQSEAMPEIFSYGHRNVQGAALHPLTDELWTHEHGPQGGDEINIVRKGKNYGWPVITYGAEYGSGDPIGEGFEKEGMEQPLYYWDPSIAPSGMAFYRGSRYPQWSGLTNHQHLLIGALKQRSLVHLIIEGERVISETHLFEDKLGRIRDVEVAADGYVYLLTDEEEGRLIRLEAINVN